MAQLPSQMGVLPAPLESLLVHSRSSLVTCSPLDNDTHVANTSAAALIKPFIHCRSSVEAARKFEGKEAQEIIEIVDQAKTLQEPDEDKKLWRQSMGFLYKMCRSHMVLPTSYTLQAGDLSVDDAVFAKGGYGKVSKGTYQGALVAVKDIGFEEGVQPDPVRFKALCREAIPWKDLSHPNVLKLLGVSPCMGQHPLRMVTPFMRNGNVMEYAKSNREANRPKLLVGITTGLSYLHDLKIIHQDLKAINILIHDDGTPLLADFGLVAPSVELKTIPLSATAPPIAGSTRWMSPELLSGEKPTKGSDIYALGMVIYEVLTGWYPFYYLEDNWRVKAAVARGERPSKPVNARLLGFSDELSELLVRCWKKSPSDRPTLDELLCHLRDIFPTWTTPDLQYPIPKDSDSPKGFDGKAASSSSLFTSEHPSRNEDATQMDTDP